MHRCVLTAAVLLAGCGAAAAADTYTCTSLDGDPPVTLEFTLGYSTHAYAVLSARFQIEGDIGYATDAADPRDLATVTGVSIAQGEIGRAHV